jgi:REP element-mobilizing transposase RayT
MTEGLRRFHQSQQSHFLAFSCYQRQPRFNAPGACDLFLDCLEAMRQRFAMRIYGYVIMPEHVHLLVSEPDHQTLADAMHFLKLSFTKRLKSILPTVQQKPVKQEPTVPQPTVPQEPTVPQVRGRSVAATLGWADIHPIPAPFWQKRYYDRNVRDEDEFTVKLRYPHRNPRGPRQARFWLAGVEVGGPWTRQKPCRLEMDQLPSLRSA